MFQKGQKARAFRENFTILIVISMRYRNVPKGKKGAERDKAEGFKFTLRSRLRLRPEDGGWRRIGRLRLRQEGRRFDASCGSRNIA